jgi:hypothetical protein
MDRNDVAEELWAHSVRNSVTSLKRSVYTYRIDRKLMKIENYKYIDVS